MKQWIGFLLAALVVAALPTGGSDVAKLQPVELVYIYVEEDSIIVRTDTGDRGQGGNLNTAFVDLEETTAGIVFLDTADYLIVTSEAEWLLPELRNYLKGSTRVCKGEGIEDLETAAKYLAAHTPETRLKYCSDAQGDLQVLEETEGRFCLKQQN